MLDRLLGSRLHHGQDRPGAPRHIVRAVAHYRDLGSVCRALLLEPGFGGDALISNFSSSRATLVADAFSTCFSLLRGSLRRGGVADFGFLVHSTSLAATDLVL